MQILILELSMFCSNLAFSLLLPDSYSVHNWRRLQARRWLVSMRGLILLAMLLGTILALGMFPSDIQCDIRAAPRCSWKGVISRCLLFACMCKKLFCSQVRFLLPGAPRLATDTPVEARRAHFVGSDGAISSETLRPDPIQLKENPT